MTSRVLPRPMNATCIGPSSVGKNATVDAAKALMPPDDIYQVDAASPMALVYTDASFERKIVLYSEMDSIPEDGPAGSAVRSLAATNSPMMSWRRARAANTQRAISAKLVPQSSLPQASNPQDNSSGRDSLKSLCQMPQSKPGTFLTGRPWKRAGRHQRPQIFNRGSTYNAG